MKLCLRREIRVAAMILLLGLPFSFAAANSDILVVTAFEPFGNHSTNASYEVAQEIQRHPEWIAASKPEIRTCVLPVEYDRAAQKGLECLSKLPRPPKMIVSLGEGDCAIRIETTAANLDHTPDFPDNAGVIRNHARILDSFPMRQPLSIPARQMFCSLPPADRLRARISYSAGNFVCNNTAFRIETHLLNESRRTGEFPPAYGFIHVPHSGCANSNASGDARIVGELIRAAWALPSFREENFPIACY